MRGIFDYNVPALLIFLVGIAIAIKFDLGYFWLALILGPVMFLADVLNGDRPSIRKAILSLSCSLILFAVGFTFSYVSGLSFVEFSNQYSFPVIRRVPLAALSLATYGLVQLTIAFLTKDDQDYTDA